MVGSDFVFAGFNFNFVGFEPKLLKFEICHLYSCTKEPLLKLPRSVNFSDAFKVRTVQKGHAGGLGLYEY